MKLIKYIESLRIRRIIAHLAWFLPVTALIGASAHGADIGYGTFLSAWIGSMLWTLIIFGWILFVAWLFDD